MTVYLAFDCATDVGSVAVGSPGMPAAEIVITGRRHASELVPAAQECLRLAGAGFGDLDGLIVADGPGSFTGLRIAFATAAGLVREHPDQAMFTAPSLLGTAWIAAQIAGEGPVAALYDALRGQVFGAVYQFEPGPRTIVAPCLTTLQELTARGVPPVLAVGDGAVAYAAQARAWTGRAPVGPPAGAPRASALIDLMKRGLLRRITDFTAWEPTYGRPAEAQVRWERAHGRALPGTPGD